MEEELAWRNPATIPNEAGLEIQVLLKNDAVVLARVAREERYGTHFLRFCDSGSELSIGTVKGWLPLTPPTAAPVTGRLPLERWLEEGKALVAALPLQEAELRGANLDGANRPTDPPAGWVSDAYGYLRGAS